MPDDLESNYRHQGYDLAFSCAIHIKEEQWAGAFVKRTVQRIENFCFKVMTGSDSYTCQHGEGLLPTFKVKCTCSFTHAA